MSVKNEVTRHITTKVIIIIIIGMTVQNGPYPLGFYASILLFLNRIIQFDILRSAMVKIYIIIQNTLHQQYSWKLYLSFGNSSLKSLDIRGVQSRTANILATISFFCQRPLQVSPLGDTAIRVCRARSAMLIPLCLDRVASPENYVNYVEWTQHGKEK